ncbi:MAG: 2-oxoacid:ferredoxin oxidoreductase subunit beta [candidate division Zixibacteria bacterium]|nr:2-oxoacid:ferredoxin oxidoreductase subunit beta [candidate division Zixibacteria bacterium]
MVQPSNITHAYLRPKKKFPNVWCAGCGIGVVLGSLVRAIDLLQLDRNLVTLISGIGCSSRMPVYLDFNTLHTTHGRALAFATGVKLANPRMKVIVVTGDGDALAIGGNHFIHSCRRNIDITTILVNNHIYGMTGGQFSPTTPTDSIGSTAPYGNMEYNFEVPKLAMAAGATYVARGTVYHVQQLDKLLNEAIVKRGFSVVDVFSNCHTYFGRFNRLGDSIQMLKALKKIALPLKAAEKLPPEKVAGKLLTGVFCDIEREEYCDRYDKLIESLQESKS